MRACVSTTDYFCHDDTVISSNSFLGVLFQVETLVLRGGQVAAVAAALRRQDLTHYDFIIVHVGACDMYNRSGIRTSFPKKLAAALLSLYQELTARIQNQQLSTHVLMSGLLPKMLPDGPGETAVAARYGINPSTAREYNRSARKTNRRLRTSLLAATGSDIMPVECRDFWGAKDSAVRRYFSVDCVHLSREGQLALAKALRKGLFECVNYRLTQL